MEFDTDAVSEGGGEHEVDKQLDCPESNQLADSTLRTTAAPETVSLDFDVVEEDNNESPAIEDVTDVNSLSTTTTDGLVVQPAGTTPNSEVAAPPPPPLSDSSVAPEEAPVSTEQPLPSAATSVPQVSSSTSVGVSSQSDSADSVYAVKWIDSGGRKRPIVTQNENGPCPLLAIVNVLLLREELILPTGTELVTSANLMNLLSERLFELVPRLPANERANVEANLAAAFDIFHKLQTGLDMNVRYSGCDQFEFTSEICVFDLFRVALVHGWLPDPSSPELEKSVLKQICASSYNQLVEFMINGKDSTDDEVVRQALVVEHFLETNSSQLTVHGLSELHRHVKENQYAVFFRNNHFSTLFKYQDHLYLLATDQGWLHQSRLVWETITVEGDSQFVDGDFRVYERPTSSEPTVDNNFTNTEQQIDADLMLAMALAQESSPAHQSQTSETDEQLARRLQEMENAAAAAAQSRQQQQPQTHLQTSEYHPNYQANQQRQARTGSSSGAGASSGTKDKDCCLL